MSFFRNSALGYIFFLHHNQNIFFSNIGNQNIFLEPPPLEVKWSVPKWAMCVRVSIVSLFLLLVDYFIIWFDSLVVFLVCHSIAYHPLALTPYSVKLAMQITECFICRYLQSNLIEIVNNTDYCQLKVLVYLRLDSNRLNETTIEEDGFKCLPTLTTL